MKFLRTATLILFSLLSVFILAIWIVGSELIAPINTQALDPPEGLKVEAVVIPTINKDYISAWWIQGSKGRPSILLAHGIRGNRIAMVDRARFLAKKGYSVLLIDLQAHGESPGDAITFGWRESDGITAARNWIRQRNPGRRIGAIGVSLGGAAILLGKMPSGFDAVVLEAVYSNIHNALVNRLSMRLGSLAQFLAPLLEIQIYPRVGIKPEMLNPIGHIAKLSAPLLILAGGRDLHTQLEESEAIYNTAVQPKLLWVLPNAKHEDFYKHDPRQYETKILGFFETFLNELKV